MMATTCASQTWNDRNNTVLDVLNAAMLHNVGVYVYLDIIGHLNLFQENLLNPAYLCLQCLVPFIKASLGSMQVTSALHV